MTQEEINAEVKALIRRSDLWSPTDSPEAVATLMVLTVLMSLVLRSRINDSVRQPGLGGLE